MKGFESSSNRWMMPIAFKEHGIAAEELEAPCPDNISSAIVGGIAYMDARAQDGFGNVRVL